MVCYQSIAAANNAIVVKPDEEIQVIGAGLAKTGTMSLFLALTTLGYRTYHMVTNVDNPEQAKKWLKIVREDKPDEVDWKGMLKGYTAAMNSPVADDYNAVFKAFPNAKVILTYREPDKWWHSLSKTQMEARTFNPFFRFATFWMPNLYLATTLLREVYQRWERRYGSFGPEIMRKRIEEVKRDIPADRLLIYHVKDGWEPLCKFLGKPIPSEPLAHVNDEASLRSATGADIRKGLLRWAEAVVLALFAGTAAMYTIGRVRA